MATRASSLPLAQFCPQVHRLSGLFGSGRSAAMSSYFHALCADAPQATRLGLGLTEEEREEIKGWVRPTELCLGDGEFEQPLLYSQATKELELAITRGGEIVKIDDPRAMLTGHLDFAWVIHESDGRKMAYVADIKRGEFTESDPDTLQLHAYGQIFATLMECDGYTTGLYYAESGEWNWSHKFIMLESALAADIWELIVHAATNTEGPAQLGPHCLRCYSRLHCPDWLIPATEPDNWAQPLADASAMDSAKAIEILLKVKAMEDLAERAKEQVKAWVAAGNRVYDEERGLLYKPVMCKGRRGVVSIADLERIAGKEEAKKYIKVGKPFSRMTWVKQ